MRSVDDFIVRLTGDRFIEMISASQGRQAWFPAWEHADRDLRHFIAADVPFGTADAPYVDEDEAWSIRIFEENGWVYVNENGSTFRVPRERYFHAWAALIDQFNPIVPLDDTE